MRRRRPRPACTRPAISAAAALLAAALLAAPPLAAESAAQDGVRITVNAADDRPPGYDGVVTLREALLYARGDRAPRGGDLLAVAGDLAGGAPAIGFDPAVFDRYRVIAVEAPLPPLDRPGTVLAGPPARLAVMPAGGRGRDWAGLRLGPGVAVTGLDLDGFGIGLDMEGDGEAEASDVTVAGALAGARAAGGGRLFLDQARAAVTLAGRLAGDGGIVDGRFAPLDVGTPGEAVLLADPEGAAARVRVAGWLPDGSRPVLYARRPAPVKLSEVAGLEGASSSYAAFRVFTAEGDQQWPSYAVDGTDAAFQWEFVGPEEREWMEIQSPRPLRTDRLTIRYRPEPASRLLAYRLSLRDLFGAEVFSSEVAAEGEEDMVAIDPLVDFATIRIDVIAADGRTPGITEIEAEVIDSVAYPAIAWSARQAAFERPPGSPAIAVALGGALHTLADAPLADGSGFGIGRLPPPVDLRPPSRLAVGADADTVAGDGVVTLREAILFANGTRPLEGGEAAALTGDGLGPLTIDLAGRNVALSAALPTITRDGVTIASGAVAAAGPALAADGVGALAIRDTAITGTVEVRNVGRFELRGGSVAAAEGPALAIADSSALLVAGRIDSRIGLEAVRSRLSLVGFRSEGGTGVLAEAGVWLNAIGSVFAGDGVPVAVQPGAGRTTLVLAANVASGSGEMGPSLAAGALDGLMAANQPPDLGIDLAALGLPGRIEAGNGLIDLRGSGRAALHAVDAGSAGAACLVEDADGRRHPAAGVVLLLLDRPADVWCASEAGAARLRVQPPSGGPPAGPGEAPPSGPVAVGAWLGITSLDLGAGTDEEVLVASGGNPRTQELAPEAVLPSPQAEAEAAAAEALAASLAAAGEPALAVDALLAAVAAAPDDARLAELAAFAAADWAGSLEAAGDFGLAAAILEEMAARLPGNATAAALLAEHRHRHALALIETADFAGARDILAGLLAADPADPVAAQNLVYTYQEWTAARLQAEPADAVLAWLFAEAERFPALADSIRATGSGAVGSALAVAIDGGDFAAAFTLAGLAYDAAPDADSRNNLLYAFQELARGAVEAGTPEIATAAYAAALAAYPDIAEFEPILAGIFNAAIEARIGAGDTEGALEMARALAGTGGENAGIVFGTTLVAAATALEAASGTEAALAFLQAELDRFPELASARGAAAAFANDRAIAALDEGRYADAIAALEAGLALSPGEETLSANLRVAYINAAVTAGNAGRFEEALAFATAGLARFPGDADLLDIQNWAASAGR